MMEVLMYVLSLALFTFLAYTFGFHRRSRLAWASEKSLRDMFTERMESEWRVLGKAFTHLYDLSECLHQYDSSLVAHGQGSREAAEAYGRLNSAQLSARRFLTSDDIHEREEGSE